MNKLLKASVQDVLGTRRALVVPAAGGDQAPVLSDEIAVLKFVEQDCGADAWTVEGGKLIAMRDNGDGTFATIKTYEIEEFGGRS